MLSGDGLTDAGGEGPPIANWNDLAIALEMTFG